MTDPILPATIFILGGLLIPLFKGKVKSIFMLMIPVTGMINLIHIPAGAYHQVAFNEFSLTLLHIDRLNLVFGYIFHIIAFITTIYILNFKNDVEYVAGAVYAGAALGTIFAGDFFTFFIFWELLTVGSVMLIWSRKTRAAQSAGYRYLLVHVFGGLVLFAGIVLHVSQTGSLDMGTMTLNAAGPILIFIGIGINCAWPALHPWLTDAYPEATIGGAVFLSAFTTKTAVYALARIFPGTELLIWIGVGMAAFPIFFAVIENDLRRVLAYSLINQVGFMVVGIGIGTELSINGAVAHAFNDILFKGLLFMSMGAVMYRTGKINATDLGGLYKCMPWTALFCCIGAASISAFPLFSGFVSKSMVMSAASHGAHLDHSLIFVWLVLLFASAGVFHHAGIKIPFFAFFGHDAGHKVKEAPLNMLVAMGIAAFLCIFIGSYPKPLYDILPYPTAYEPYTISHVLTQTELLFFSALAFTLLLLSGIYPAEMRAINLDSDWLYRKGGRLFSLSADKLFNGLNTWSDRVIARGLSGRVSAFFQNGAEKLILMVTIPILALKRMDKSEIDVYKIYTKRSLETGSIPLGISAIAAALFLVLIFLLS
jgi:multicomponent Na+:H+ antiporter subunit D